MEFQAHCLLTPTHLSGFHAFSTVSFHLSSPPGWPATHCAGLDVLWVGGIGSSDHSMTGSDLPGYKAWTKTIIWAYSSLRTCFPGMFLPDNAKHSWLPSKMGFSPSEWPSYPAKPSLVSSTVFGIEINPAVSKDKNENKHKNKPLLHCKEWENWPFFNIRNFKQMVS